MSEKERISSIELKILAAFDVGKSPEEIAELEGMSVAEVKEILDTAQKKREELVSEAREDRTVFVYYRPIDDTIGVPQKGTMKVGSQILKLLSEGIYSSPANSIKELISNGFDSDATNVRITFDGNELVVWDNGKGMDYRDFDEEFVYISRSRKRDKGEFTEKYKRPIVGFIGIGFVAVSELCDIITIVSCKEDSGLMFEAKIDFSVSRAPEAVSKEFYEVSQFELTNYRKTDKGYDADAHFTEIRLQKLRPVLKTMLSDKRPFDSRKVTISDLLDHLEAREVKSLASLGGYWQTLLQIAYTSPVEYLDEGPVKGVSGEYEILEQIKDRLKSYNFEATFDGISLKKPIRFPIEKRKMDYELEYYVHPFRETATVEGKKLSFEGYIYSQHGNIDPKEYNGIIIRIRNVAVGIPDRTLLSYPLLTNLVFRHWIFGEVYIIEGLEEAMTIDRSSFKFTHSHYQRLQSYLHHFLDNVVFDYTLRSYYRAKRKRKKEALDKKQNQLLTDVIASEMGKTFDLELSYAEHPVMVDTRREKVIVNQRHSTLRRVPKRTRFAVELLLVLFEIAMTKSGGNVEKLRSLFLKSVKEWMKTL